MLDTNYKNLFDNYQQVLEIAQKHKSNVLNLRKELSSKKKTL